MWYPIVSICTAGQCILGMCSVCLLVDICVLWVCVLLQCVCPTKYLCCVVTGPLPTTIGDFWRMIWEYKATDVVMLTGVVEAGKV